MAAAAAAAAAAAGRDRVSEGRHGVCTAVCVGCVCVLCCVGVEDRRKEKQAASEATISDDWRSLQGCACGEERGKGVMCEWSVINMRHGQPGVRCQDFVVGAVWHGEEKKGRAKKHQVHVGVASPRGAKGQTQARCRGPCACDVLQDVCQFIAWPRPRVEVLCAA